MKIRVNGQEVEIFSGAKVGDALRKYSRADWNLVRNNEKKVTDRYGQEVGLDGELNGGEELRVADRVPPEPRS
jgi:sulfur carrier protein ThiS